MLCQSIHHQQSQLESYSLNSCTDYQNMGSTFENSSIEGLYQLLCRLGTFDDDIESDALQIEIQVSTVLLLHSKVGELQIALNVVFIE